FDISTGELRAARLADLAATLAELSHAAPRELLVGGDDADSLLDVGTLSVAGLAAPRHDPPLDDEQLLEALGGLAGDAEQLGDEERMAVGRVLRFARACTPGVELPVVAIGRWDPSSSLVIDPNAQRHLELVESNTGDPKA